MKLGIIGGMGPVATAKFYLKMLQYSNFTTDQSHIRTIIDVNTNISDRTHYILTNDDSPLAELKKSRDLLINEGCDVICMLSNSAHVFIDELKSKKTRFLDMTQIIKSQLSNKNIKDVFLIGSTGLIKTDLFNKNTDVRFHYPTQEYMKLVMRWIYDLKAGKEIDRREIVELINEMNKNKYPVLIACVELEVYLYNENYSDGFILSTYELIKKIYMYI